MSPMRRFRPIRTYSDAWLQRHRDTHARHVVFGTHRHPYLRETIQRLAQASMGDERPSLLDYGCGKGVFLREMQQSGQFRYAMGYDPAVDAFRQRPAQVYDIVLCLDVLDQTEDEFVEPVIEDVAQFVGRFAVFDVITVQTPELAHLDPRSAEAWGEMIGRWMSVDEVIVRAATAEELREGACPERVIVIGSPSRGL
ncbi:MAG: methyltransferase domain-containing protein [Acetobacteraceae bacterium]